MYETLSDCVLGADRRVWGLVTLLSRLMAPPSKPPPSRPPDEPPPRDALFREGSTSAKEFDLSAKLRNEKPGLV